MDKQFDERFALTPVRSDNPGLRKRTEFVAGQQREALALQRRRPANIAWFENALADRGGNETRPVIGTFCNLVPPEIIEALGAVPVRLCCGNSALVQAGEEVLHGEICPLAKSSFAEFLDPQSAANRCAALLVPATCDPKRKLGEALSDFKPVFMLNIPPEQDFSRYGRMVETEFRRMTGFLEEQLGVRLRRRALLKAVRDGQRRALAARRLQELHAGKPGALSFRDAMVIIQAAGAGADPEQWLAETEKTIREIEAYQPLRTRLRPRLVLTGAPLIWPNFKLLAILEESGADVVADTICTGFQGASDAVAFNESGTGALMRALASRYVFGSPCPCFVSQGTRIARVLELAEQFKADGVINHGLRLCQLFDIEVYRLSQVLKSRRIPFANIRTDYSLEDTEQLRVRIEAFLETLGETA